MKRACDIESSTAASRVHSVELSYKNPPLVVYGTSLNVSLDRKPDGHVSQGKSVCCLLSSDKLPI